MIRRIRPAALAVLWLGALVPARAQAPSLLRDVHTTGSASPARYASTGSAAYFLANDGAHGQELWRSDGTAPGTRIVKDIHPGAGHANPSGMTLGHGLLWFAADDGVHGGELWRSDGTAAGTWMVRDLEPAGTSAPFGFTAFSDHVYFKAFTTANGSELWRTDGTAAGTQLVVDLVPGPGGSYPGGLTSYRGSLFFTCTQGLFCTDGTAAGTHRLHSGTIGYLARAGSHLVFGTGRNELWRTDGTAAGTRRVSSQPIAMDILVEAGGRVFLNGPTGGLAVTDGLTVVTLASVQASKITAVGADVFFVAHTPAEGLELWHSDGTPAGTRLVRDLRPGAAGSAPFGLSALGSRYLAFGANDGSHGNEPWISDGTAAGTRLLADVTPGAGDGVRTDLHFAMADGRAVFTAQHPSAGLEPFVLDPGASARAVGQGCGGRSWPSRLEASDPVLGAKLTCTLRDATQISGGVLAAGFPASAALPLGSGCMVYVDLTQHWFVLAPIAAPPSPLSIAVPLPNDARFTGLSLMAQVWLLGNIVPGGLETTNGVHLRLGY